MSTKTRNRTENQAPQEGSPARTSSEVLAILAPSIEDPRPIRTAGIWKTGSDAVPTDRSKA